MLNASIESAKDLLLAEKLETDPPKRFRRLGGGAYRQAYLDEDANVVYKLDHDGRHSTRGGNTSEVTNLSYLEGSLPYVCDDGTVIRLPEWEAYRFGSVYVIAMEYCPAAADVAYSDQYRAGAWFGLTDTAGSNCRWAAGKEFEEAVLTDVGLSSSGRPLGTPSPEDPEPQPAVEPVRRSGDCFIKVWAA